MSAASAAFALNNGTKRAKIFDLLANGALDTREVARRMNITRQAAIDHLLALEAHSLVTTNRVRGFGVPFVWTQAGPLKEANKQDE